MLTARGLSADKLEGFAVGADDYIVKPFDTPELLARIRGVLRRAKRDARAVAAHRPARQRPDRGGDRAAVRSRRRSSPSSTPDLDHFKAYNDHYGFMRGDQVDPGDAAG